MASFKDHFQRLFNKGRSITVLEYSNDGKVREYFRIPEKNGDVVVFGKRYKFNPKHLFRFKGYPAILVDANKDNAEPLILDHPYEPLFPATDYQKAMNSKVVIDFVEASKEKPDNSFIWFVVILAAIGVVAFMIMNKLTQMESEPVETALKIFGGF